MRRADSRAAWIAGSKSATKMPMIAMTTNNSTNVNAFLGYIGVFSAYPTEARKALRERHSSQLCWSEMRDSRAVSALHQKEPQNAGADHQPRSEIRRPAPED